SFPVDCPSGSWGKLFNQALKQSQGKYIVALNCTDELAPTFLEESLLKLEASPPHFFIQSLNDSLQSDSDDQVSLPLLEALDRDRFRPLIFPRSTATKLEGYSEAMQNECLAWEFYVNLLRHGYKGCQVSGRIFKGYLSSVQSGSGFELGLDSGREQIRVLYLGAMVNHKAQLERRLHQYWQVTGSLCNLLPLPQAKREKVVWLDLLKVSFVPWELLPALKEWTKVSQKPLIVTVSSHFRNFFLYNKTAGVRVYFPEEYHLQGDKEYLSGYIKGRYTLQSILPAEILAKVRAQPVEVVKRSSDKKKLRILYASPWLITGGADTMTVDWFRELEEEWCEKYFVTTLSNHNNWLPKIADYAAGVFDLPALGCSSLAEVTSFLLDFITRYQIDILHIMNSEVAFNALPKLKEHFPYLKVVAQFHCFDYFSDGRQTGYPFTMPPRYDHLIDSYNLEYPQLGAEIVELYPYVNPAKFKVIHGSIDSLSFTPLAQSPSLERACERQEKVLTLLFIGRLDRQKQPLRLLKVASALRRDGVAFVMHIIGDGSLESQKKEFLAKLKREGLEDVVCWHGEQPLESLIGWYQAADILLLTSDWEGVPMVLYQAMAMQVIPVVADVGGCAELVIPGCGYLVTEPDNPAGYVAAIKELVNDKQRQRVAAAARKRMLKDFSLADLDRKYRDYYRSLV
ncbi:glycosyltransferase family 4 protein, partial [bacterium]|nr:glycosyltransferase family 4 protein [bacterium]